MHFRNQLSRQHKSKKTEGDLYRSQKACHQLDQSKGFTEPVETWFWPEAKDDDNVELEEEEYCDEHSDNADESDEGEPIVELSDQENVKETKKNNQDKYVNSGEFLPEEKLQMITEYLRSQYLYCLWCGITFSDLEDMNSSCPGLTREDHDE